MKIKLVFFLSLISLVLSNCRKEVVSLNPYEQSILENSIYSLIPQFQSSKETLILKHNNVMSMSFIKEYSENNEIDSLTYLRFDRDGKLIQRTTNQVTTVGCLPQTIVQIFRYEKDKIKKVENYTFRYKTNSEFEKWMEIDTSRLRMFDWEDYSYNGDTILVESGFAKWKFIKNKNGNLVSQLLNIKHSNEKSDISYISVPNGIKVQIKNNDEKSSLKDLLEYEVENNKVKEKPYVFDKIDRTENIFNDEGLLIGKIHYKNNKIIARTKITYYYY